jgi:hypothetical protein
MAYYQEIAACGLKHFMINSMNIEPNFTVSITLYFKLFIVCCYE